MGWIQGSEERLLQEAEIAGYDVFLTNDQGIRHQQNLSRRTIAILVIQAPTNKLGDLIPKTAAILQALAEIQPGEIVLV